MHNEIDQLGMIIKAARIEKDLTRKQLAKRLRITPRYLMSIENENKKPSFDLLFQLIRILGIPSDTIFYPESHHNNVEIEKLVRLLYLCDERSLKVVYVTANALITID